MHHHLVVVAAGAAAHFVTGWVLNCELLLGKIWKHEKDKKACGTLSKDMRVNLAAQIVASIALAIGVSVAIAIFNKAQVPAAGTTALEKLANLFFNQDHTTKSMMNSMYTVLFVWAGFILPNCASEVIWCGHNWRHWLLEQAADLLGLMAIAATVTFLS